MNYSDNQQKRDDIELLVSHENINSNNENSEAESEIDLLELAMKLWQQRKKIIKWCAVGAVLGLIVAFSIPREYETTVKLAPEFSASQKSSSGLSSLMSMAGLSSTSQTTDALYPQLYPDVVGSVPFALSLFDVPVKDIEGEKNTTVRAFLEEDTKSPWWSAILALPGEIIGGIKSLMSDEEDLGNHSPNSFHLTNDEDLIVTALSQRISATVDTKTQVITISVKMQDPMVSAILADTVVYRLQEYITDYRTNKARKDLEYAETLNQEAKDNYYKAQQQYADYLDRNQGLILHSAQTTRERLENEATLAFNLYNQTSQQLQAAKAKVQENTPVYAIVTPATVPIKPAAPRKAMILIGFIFLSFVACSAWILYGKPMLDEIKHKKLETTNQN